MTRVLFVDDEPKVLRGLQRLLLDLDSDWEAEFAASGREALELLAERRFDVVVSDMRMPEMDGAALLSEVRARYPDVVRMVLSGHSDRELVFRSVSAAHCYLSKPCDPDQLRTVVARAVGLRHFLTNSRLRGLVSRLDKLPSLPRIYREVVAELEGPSVSLKRLGDMISQDLGMTAKILQLVNSSFFGVPRHVSDPTHAVCLLGQEVLKALILTVHIFSSLGKGSLGELGLDSLWDHSAQTATIARGLAVLENACPDVRDFSFMAGLLHDIGRLILAINLPDAYVEAVQLSLGGRPSLLDAEVQVFGATHAEVGAYLLGIWGLPDAIVEAVAFHHRPGQSVIDGFGPVTAVHVADVLEHAQRASDVDAQIGLVDDAYLKRIGVKGRMALWRDAFLGKVHA